MSMQSGHVRFRFPAESGLLSVQRTLRVKGFLSLVALALLAPCVPVHAQFEIAAVEIPALIGHESVLPSIAAPKLVDRSAGKEPSAAPVLMLRAPSRWRSPIWHTADVEGGQTSIRPTSPYEKCRCYSNDGGNGSMVYHLTDHFGVAADGSRISAGSPEQPLNLTSYLAGPQASVLIGNHILFFGHALVGKADLDGQTNQGRAFSASTVEMAWGGGVDVILNRDTSLRLAQVDDFINTFQRSEGLGQNNPRFTFGVVFRLGR